MSTFTDAERDAGDLAKLVNENTTVETRYGKQPKKSWLYMEGEFNDFLESAQGRGAYYVVGSFEAGFTYTDINQTGTYNNGGTIEYYVFTGGLDDLPHAVGAGTNPVGDSNYARVNYNQSNQVFNDDGSTVQDSLDSINKNITVKTIQDVLSSESTPDSFSCLFFDVSSKLNSGSEWVFTGQTLPTKSNTTDLPNGFIYNSNGDEYRINNNILFASMFGVTESNTENLGYFIEYCWKNFKQANIHSGDYGINEPLINLTVPCLASFVCDNGIATLTYSGPAISKLLYAEQAENVLFSNIKINASNLVAAPIDIRKTVGASGVCAALNTEVINAKQVGSITTNPSGILISGEYRVVDIINTTVDSVTYEDLERSSTGIGVVQFTGVANIINSHVSSVLTPSGIDADGIKVFGKEFPGSLPTSGKAVISCCKLHNCQGRAVKMQIRDWEAHSNTVSLSDGFETITEWRGFDGQDGGGNVHDNNYEFGSGIVWGSSAKLVQFSNSRNDDVTKISIFKDNITNSKTDGLSLLAGINVSYGNCNIEITGNKQLGATLSRGVQFRAQEGSSSLGSVNIKFNGNEFEDLTNQDLFLPFDAVDFTGKLRLEFLGNTVKNKNSLSRFYNSLTGFSVGSDFRIGNNNSIQDRIDWDFDMNEIEGWNSFSFADQTVSNAAGGIGNFGYVITDGVVQRMFNNSGNAEARRVDLGTWVTV